MIELNLVYSRNLHMGDVPEGEYRCRGCALVFPDNQDTKDHERRCNIFRPYRCEYFIPFRYTACLERGSDQLFVYR